MYKGSICKWDKHICKHISFLCLYIKQWVFQEECINNYYRSTCYFFPLISEQDVLEEWNDYNLLQSMTHYTLIYLSDKLIGSHTRIVPLELALLTLTCSRDIIPHLACQLNEWEAIAHDVHAQHNFMLMPLNFRRLEFRMEAMDLSCWKGQTSCGGSAPSFIQRFYWPTWKCLS